MLSYEDIQIQLVDTPPLAPETLEPWQLVMIQQADAGLLLFDVNNPDLLVQTDFILAVFKDREIVLDGSQGPPLFVLGNKIDDPQGGVNFSAWQELYQEQFRAEPFSALSEEDLGEIPQRLFDALEIVRVYTKAPGKKPDPEF
jgi:ribosome-interacting GTPase 1